MIKNRFNSFIKKVYDLEKTRKDNNNIYVNSEVNRQMLQDFYNDKQIQLKVEQLILNQQNISGSGSELSEISCSYQPIYQDHIFDENQANLMQYLNQNALDLN